MRPDSHIRPFNPETDWPLVKEIERVCFPKEGWNRETYQEFIDEDGGYCYVIELDGVDCGTVWIADYCIASIGILSGFRNRGLGRELLICALDKIEHQGFQIAELDVRPENIPAQRLYHEYDFVPVSYDPHYYHENDGAIRMRRPFYDSIRYT